MERGSNPPSFRIPTRDERELLLDEDVDTPRLPQCLIMSGLERTESALWAKMSDILLKGYVEVEGIGGISAGDTKGSDQAARDSGRASEKINFPSGFWVIWVRDEDKSEKCPPWLVSFSYTFATSS